MPGSPRSCGAPCRGGGRPEAHQHTHTHTSSLSHHFCSVSAGDDRASFVLLPSDDMMPEWRGSWRRSSLEGPSWWGERRNVCVGWDSLWFMEPSALCRLMTPSKTPSFCLTAHPASIYCPSLFSLVVNSQQILSPLMKQEGTSQQKHIIWTEWDKPESLTLTASSSPDHSSQKTIYCSYNKTSCSPAQSNWKRLNPLVNPTENINV